MDDHFLNRKARANEAIVEKQFKKLGYIAKRLDYQKPDARPDFLIRRSRFPQFLCEVKTIFSAGYLSERGAHISMYDPRLVGTGVLQNEIDLSRINSCLSDSVRKYSALASDRPELAKLPFVVAFFFDFFADFLPFYPREMDERFQDISGILTIKRDVARTNAFERLDAQEQELRLRMGLEFGLPPNSMDFVLVRNKTARRPVPRDFQLMCLTESYDQSG